jgi:dolichol kinase
VGYTLLLNYTTPRIAILAITGLLLLLLEIEYIRLEHRPRIAEAIDGFLRKHEKTQISSAVFLLISIIICFGAFDYWVAFLALSMTVFGDLFAALFGRAFGKTKIYGNKTYIGTLACLATNMIIGFLTMPNMILLFAPMAITATVFELFTKKMDDNLTVPLFAGFAGQMIVYFFALELPPVAFTLFGLFN